MVRSRNVNLTCLIGGEQRHPSSQAPAVTTDTSHLQLQRLLQATPASRPRLTQGIIPPRSPFAGVTLRPDPLCFRAALGPSTPAPPSGAASLFWPVPGTLLLCNLSAARLSEAFSRCHQPRLHPTTQPQLLSSRHVFWGVSSLTKMSQDHPSVKQELRCHPLKTPTCF